MALPKHSKQKKIASITPWATKQQKATESAISPCTKTMAIPLIPLENLQKSERETQIFPSEGLQPKKKACVYMDWN